MEEVKDELLGDIREDLNGITDVEQIRSFNYALLCGMYKNKQEEVVFIRTIHSELTNGILRAIRAGDTMRFSVCMGVLHEVYTCTRKSIDIEMTIESIEAVNQYLYRIGKRGTGDSALRRAIDYSYDVWMRLKALGAVRVCLLPFLSHEYELAAVEEELDSIEATLWGILENK
jgi:hypothetical protein